MDKGFELVMIEVGEQDYVHVFISSRPQVAPSYMVKMMKGISARKLLLRFPELQKKLWKGHFWNSSFYIETVGSVSEENKSKISKQKGDVIVQEDLSNCESQIIADFGAVKHLMGIIRIDSEII